MEERIDILIGKYVSNNISSEDEKVLMDWIKENPANIITFNKIEKLWNLSSNLKIEKKRDVSKAWSEFQSLVNTQPERKKTEFKYYKIAASLIIFFSLCVFLKLIFFKPNNSVNDLSMITIITKDSSKVFFLPDSSQIHLNKQSSFKYPEQFATNERKVILNGEAFFEVKSDSIPFIISCQKTITRVVGTSFNIKSFDEDKNVEVIVVTGRVELSDEEGKSKKIVLTENDCGTFNKETISLTKTENKKQDFKWWKKDKVNRDIKKIIKKVKHKLK